MIRIETFFRGVHKTGSDVKETLDKLSRKGCNYCLKTNPEYAGCSDIWHDNELSVGYGNYIEINFCPMCGRYLRVFGQVLCGQGGAGG